MIRYYELGLTPNPDVLCNRFVKFNCLPQCVLKKSLLVGDQHLCNNVQIEADAIATGHYCRHSLEKTSSNTESEGEAKLLRSCDPVKDQTFWLSTVKTYIYIYNLFKICFLRFVNSIDDIVFQYL